MSDDAARGWDAHLRDLRYFVAVAEELHFTHAAERLEIAQPTLSRQVRQLETQLGVTLLDRDQRSVALTVAGREFLAGVRQVLALWDDVSSGLTAASETLRVGLAPTVGRDVLTDFEESTGQRLEQHIANLSDVTCGLATRESDIAVLWLPVPDADRYDWHVLRSEARFVVLPESHPLAERAEIAFTDLFDEPFIALPAEAGPARDFWIGNDARSGRRALIGGEAATPEERIEEIGMGRGVCLIAEENVPLYRWPGLVARRVAGLNPCELVMAWRRDEENQRVREFVAAARPR